MWLACRGRIWTADRGFRRGLDAPAACVLCNQLPETVDHLIVTCPIARETYWLTFSWARCACPFGNQGTVLEWWKHLVNTQTARRRKGAGSLFMIVAW
jgi:hypothetical protein